MGNLKQRANITAELVKILGPGCVCTYNLHCPPGRWITAR